MISARNEGKMFLQVNPGAAERKGEEKWLLPDLSLPEYSVSPAIVTLTLIRHLLDAWIIFNKYCGYLLNY